MGKRVADMTPEQIEARRARERERYANNPEYRERHRKGQREKYANDPEFRQRHRERQRVANMTPERLEGHRERNRTRDAQRIQVDGVRFRNRDAAVAAVLRLLGVSDANKEKIAAYMAAYHAANKEKDHGAARTLRVTVGAATFRNRDDTP